MFFAAPMPTGIDSAMPITVETTVIQRLSSMPSALSLQRLTKSGGKNAEKNFAPRGRPSQTRVQFTTAAPSASDQRSQARWIIGGFFQRRGEVAAIDMTTSARPCGLGLGAAIPAE